MYSSISFHGINGEFKIEEFTETIKKEKIPEEYYDFIDSLTLKQYRNNSLSDEFCETYHIFKRRYRNVENNNVLVFEFSVSENEIKALSHTTDIENIICNINVYQAQYDYLAKELNSNNSITVFIKSQHHKIVDYDIYYLPYERIVANYMIPVSGNKYNECRDLGKLIKLNFSKGE